MKNIIKSGLILVVLIAIGCGGGDSTSKTVKEKEEHASSIGNRVQNAILVDANGQIAKQDDLGVYTFATTPAYPITVKKNNKELTYVGDKEYKLTSNLLSCSKIKTSSSIYINSNSQCQSRKLNLELKKANLDLEDVKVKNIKYILMATVVNIDNTTKDIKNKAPTANITGDIQKLEGEVIILNGNSSIDSDGNITKYEWLDDNNNSLHIGDTLTKGNFSVGTHTITLVVTDDKGATGSETITITILAKFRATIQPQNNQTNIKTDSNITITFSKLVTTSTLTTTNITLTKQGNTTPLSYGKFQTTSNNQTILTIDPTSPLEHNTTYAITLKDITNQTGTMIKPNPTTTTFKTIIQSTSSRSTKVLKTGQTKSYEQDGTEVTDGSIKDDGYYQKGLARSYTRNGNIVIDNVTKLQWQDDATVKTTRKSWADAKTHCQNLTLDGFSDWRLPSISELGSIVDLGRRNPPIDPTFQNTSSGYFWTSTTNASNTSNAWVVNFDGGDNYWDGKSDSNSVRCVRAGQ